MEHFGLRVLTDTADAEPVTSDRHQVPGIETEANQHDETEFVAGIDAVSTHVEQPDETHGKM